MHAGVVQHATRRRWVPALAFALVVAGCGARWSDEERAAVFARQQAGGAGVTTTTTGFGGPSVAVGDETLATSPVVPGAITPGSTPGAGKAALPCAAPSDAPGVTADRIVVASISSLSGPIPGFGNSAAGAARAYVEYRNSTGGVCGRKIELRAADDGAEGNRYRAAMADFEPDVLGVVGGQAGGDLGGKSIVEASGIPVVAAVVSREFAKAPTMFNMYPAPANLNAATGKYTWLRDQGVRRAAVVFVAVAGSQATANEHAALLEAAGIDVVLMLTVPLTTLSYDSAARAVVNSGAEFLYMVHAADASAAMARSLRDAGGGPKFADYLSAYGSSFIEQAGGAAEGATSWIPALPSEDGGTVPEHAAFLGWMQRVAPSEGPDVFANLSWAATKAFFDAVEGLPGPISRQGIVDQLRTFTAYDAGGLLGTTDLAHETTRSCAVGMVVQGGAWRRLAPASGFLC